MDFLVRTVRDPKLIKKMIENYAKNQHLDAELVVGNLKRFTKELDIEPVGKTLLGMRYLEDDGLEMNQALLIVHSSQVVKIFRV